MSVLELGQRAFDLATRAELNLAFERAYSELLDGQRCRLQSWAEDLSCTVDDLLDALAGRLALQYDSRSLPYEAGDRAINGLYSDQVDSPGASDGLFWQVYLAFDAGEFHRAPDRSDHPELITRDLIARIVEALGLARRLDGVLQFELADARAAHAPFQKN